MRALTFHGIEDVRLTQVPDPTLVDPRDALVIPLRAAICGSDLHAVQGREKGLDPGTVLGHEIYGEVLEVGSDVQGIRPGDRVVAPFTTSCGECPPCLSGLTARCELGQLFGWSSNGQGLQGTQADLLRVPLADSTLVSVPPGVSGARALLSGDVLSTGMFCALQAGAADCQVLAVVGAGPVGLMAALCALHLGAAQVFVLDSIAERLELAARFGATPLSIVDGAAERELLALTEGRGVDAVCECVGSPAASRASIDLLRPGGTLSAVGVHTEVSFAFSPGEAYDKNLTYRAGRCPARALMDTTLPLALDPSWPLEELFTHRVPLEHGAEAYRIFGAREEGCVKVLLELG